MNLLNFFKKFWKEEEESITTAIAVVQTIKYERDARSIGINFSGVKGKGTNYTDAKLMYADFRNADLEGANFTNANLYRADLRGANLTNAILTNAVLIEAHIEGTIF